MLWLPRGRQRQGEPPPRDGTPQRARHGAAHRWNERRAPPRAGRSVRETPGCGRLRAPRRRSTVPRPRESTLGGPRRSPTAPAARWALRRTQGLAPVPSLHHHRVARVRELLITTPNRSRPIGALIEGAPPGYPFVRVARYQGWAGRRLDASGSAVLPRSPRRRDGGHTHQGLSSVVAPSLPQDTRWWASHQAAGPQSCQTQPLSRTLSAEAAFGEPPTDATNSRRA